MEKRKFSTYNASYFNQHVYNTQYIININCRESDTFHAKRSMVKLRNQPIFQQQARKRAKNVNHSQLAKVVKNQEDHQKHQKI